MKTHENTLEALESWIAAKTQHAPASEQIMPINGQTLADLVADVRELQAQRGPRVQAMIKANRTS